MCHVFYAMALGAARDGLLFVVCGFLGLVLFWFAWLHCLGLGWALVWFSGLVVLTVALAGFCALLCGVGWGLFVGFVWRV